MITLLSYNIYNILLKFKYNINVEASWVLGWVKPGSISNIPHSSTSWINYNVHARNYLITLDQAAFIPHESYLNVLGD